MNTNKANQRGSPHNQCFSNEYISLCTLYLIDGNQYTLVHLSLKEKIKAIRNPDDEQLQLIHSEMCAWIKRLIKIYETAEDQ